MVADYCITLYATTMAHETTGSTKEKQGDFQETVTSHLTLDEILNNPAYRDLVCALALNEQLDSDSQIEFENLDYSRLHAMGLLEGGTIMGKTIITGGLTAFGEEVIRAISISPESPVGDNGRFQFTRQ